MVLAAAAGALLPTAPALAGTHTLNFDSAGSGTVTSSGPAGLTMPQNPVTFNASGSTQSNPNALRRAGNCPNSGANCTTGDHRLEMNFSRPARSISMRVGTVVPSTCFELDCPTMRLYGYNSSGSVVAATPPTTVTSTTITHPLSIDAFAFAITKAIYVVSGDPITGVRQSGDGHQFTAQIDNLTYNVFEPGDPPPPPPPPAPSVSISDPAAGDTFASTDFSVTGRVSAPAGVALFCIVANGGASIPGECNRTGVVAGDGSFSEFRISGLRPGANTIRAWVMDGLGRVSSDSVDVGVAEGDVDFVAETLEVTQAIQVRELPEATFNTADVGPLRRGLPSSPASTYDGVPLSEEKTTIARLYGAARGAEGLVRGATALLWGYRRTTPRHGRSRVRPLPGSPVRPHFTPTGLQAEPDLAALRADEAGSFNFVLPSSWTRNRTILVGEVAPPSVSTPTRECCPDNNRFALTALRFTPTRTATIYPVALRNDRDSPATPAGELARYFEDMRVVWPGRLRIGSSLRTVNVTDVADRVRAEGGDFHGSVIDRLEEVYGDMPLDGKLMGLLADGNCAGNAPGRTIAASCPELGFEIVAHEAGHGLGLRHAHSPDDDSFECASADLGDRGPIRGVGLDTRLWSGSGMGRFAPVGAEEADVFDATPDAPDNVYDYMSYCSSERGLPFPGTAWVSTGYWATTVRELAPGGRIDVGFSGACCFLGAASDPTVPRSSRRGRGAGAERRIVRVSALLDPAGGQHRILRVEPGKGRPADYVAGGSGPKAQVIVRRADGRVISATEVASQLASEGGGGQYVHAAVPSGVGAARVEVRRAGALLVERAASPNAPRARLRRPKGGRRIRAGSFKLTWRASDADGDPLTSRLEFSSDRGKTWRGLAAGLSGGTARVSGRALPRTKKGILRVVVSDGFNVDRSRVKRIRSKGSKPKALISVPGGRRLRVLGDTSLAFKGEAFDDRGRPIRNKKLRWVSKGRRIGKGAEIDAPVHRLGRKVKLVATDYAKRRGTDTLKLRIKKVAPLFTTLRARKLGRKSRRLRLKLASTLPGKVTVSGKRVKRKRKRVGTKPRNVKVKLTGRRRNSHEVKLKLRAGGKKTRERLDVTRR